MHLRAFTLSAALGLSVLTAAAPIESTASRSSSSAATIQARGRTSDVASALQDVDDSFTSRNTPSGSEIVARSPPIKQLAQITDSLAAEAVSRAERPLLQQPREVLGSTSTLPAASHSSVPGAASAPAAAREEQLFESSTGLAALGGLSQPHDASKLASGGEKSSSSKDALEQASLWLKFERAKRVYLKTQVAKGVAGSHEKPVAVESRVLAAERQVDELRQSYETLQRPPVSRQLSFDEARKALKSATMRLDKVPSRKRPITEDKMAALVENVQQAQHAYDEAMRDPANIAAEARWRRERAAQRKKSSNINKKQKVNTDASAEGTVSPSISTLIDASRSEDGAASVAASTSTEAPASSSDQSHYLPDSPTMAALMADMDEHDLW